MATILGGLVIPLSLSTVGLTTGVAKAEAELEALQAKITGQAAAGGGGFPIVAAAAAAATLALGAFAVASVEAASTFQNEMLLIQTQAGASAADVQNMTDAVLKLAPAVGIGPDELAKGLFHIESVGISGAAAIDLLRIAAEGAQVGNANLEDVTNGLVSVLKSGIDPTLSLAQTMGLLNGAVGTGNLRMQDLVASFSSGILPVAKELGISLQDVLAAITAMSDQMSGNVSRAVTQLRFAFVSLASPTAVADRNLAAIGLSSTAIADQLRGPGGLMAALTLLKTRMDAAGLDATQQADLIFGSFGRARSATGLLSLLTNLPLLGQKEDLLAQKSQTFFADFTAKSQTAAFQFDQFKATVEVLAIDFGNVLLPAALNIARALGDIASQTGIVVPVLTGLLYLVTLLAVRAGVGVAANLAGIAIGLAQTGLAAAAATGPVGGFLAVIDALGGPVTLIAIAFTLLITNLDKVRLGFQNLQLGVVEFQLGLVSLDQTLGIIPQSVAQPLINSLLQQKNALLAAADAAEAQRQAAQGGTGALGDYQQALDQIKQAEADAAAQGNNFTGALQKTRTAAQQLKDITSGPQSVSDALAGLYDAIKNPVNLAAEYLRDQNLIAGWAQAQSSSIPQVRIAYQALSDAAQAEMTNILDEMGPDAQAQIDAYQKAVLAGTATVAGAWVSVAGAMRVSWRTALNAAALGETEVKKIADGLKSAKSTTDIQSAVKELHAELVKGWDITGKHGELAYLLGVAFSKDVVHGLNNKDPLAQFDAASLVASIEAKLAAVAPPGSKLADSIIASLQKQLRSKDKEKAAIAAQIIAFLTPPDSATGPIATSLANSLTKHLVQTFGGIQYTGIGGKATGSFIVQPIQDAVDAASGTGGPLAQAGQDAGTAMASGLSDSTTTAAVGDATGALTESIGQRMAAFEPTARRWGFLTGLAYANGLHAATTFVKIAAYNLAYAAKAALAAGSPPGPESPLHLIDVWGYRTGLAWTTGLVSGIDGAKNAISKSLGAVASSFGSPGLGLAAATAASGAVRSSGTVNHFGPFHYTGPGGAQEATRFGQQVLDTISTGLRDQSLRSSGARKLP